MGWALKVNAKEGITDLAYQDATDYFMKQRFVVLPRRAEPRTSELLTEKQLTGLFSRLETKRVSGVSVARKVRGRQTSKSSRKRRHPQSEDEEEAQASSDDDPEEDEAEGKMDEEDLIRA
ncbi:hypothetical protein PENTCL1PPCAC_786 [Pristionchus entomophagus]|uniref:Uncharacterized protein n=1 Tax=Pristionchus entomophagus TaxID=358040 RepID=A0AAV5S6X2_9BILA|nr:hypothetical protein PENTCL1PPCAC_786 [Pristionchus entomophagus]